MRRRLASVLCVLGLSSSACSGQASREHAASPSAPATNSTVTPEPLVFASPSADAKSERVPAPEPATPEKSLAAKAPAPPEGAPPTPPSAPPAAESPTLVTLRRYYSDLNRRQFEAARYFAPQVKAYISMKKPTPKAIDHYIRDVFPKQFESYEFLFDENTLRADGPNAFTFAERSRYYAVSSHEFRTNLAQVRVEFDADGKLVDFRHVKVLEREKLLEER